MKIKIEITTQDNNQSEPKVYEAALRLTDESDKKTLIRNLFDAVILGINND